MAAARQQCEFHLLRYVPDPVRNEFVHVGVILREAGREFAGSNGDPGRDGRATEESKFRGGIAGRTVLRFTKDWRRVRCMDPEADIGMLEGLESELRRRFGDEVQASGNLMRLLEESLSNSVQMTESKAYLAESVEAGVEELMRMYVDPMKREKLPRLAGRAAIQQQMRTEFERAGVWDLLRKRIEAAQYTRVGDPLRIDVGYRPNGVIRMFQAVSLDAGAEMAKVLAFSEAGLRAGVERVEKAGLELTAIVEPVRRTGSGKATTKGGESGARGEGRVARDEGQGNRDEGRGAGGEGQGMRGEGRRARGEGSGDEEFDEERLAAYRFAVETMEEHRIRVLTTSDLTRVAETARRELRV